MGTIAEKGAYTIETKSLLKQKINNLGGSIDNNTTFRNYANQLQNVYDNLPKTEYQTGTEVNLGKTIKGKLDYDNGVVGIGQSSQESTQGYNELNIYAVHSAGYTETVSGVTFKYNDDGSVTANGKATADINYFLGSRASLGDMFNGTYYLSGCTTGSNTTYYLQFWADTVGTYVQTTNEVQTSKTSGVNWNITIAVKNGATINYTFYPMMCATSGKTYEQYSGGYSSPSPNWEQEIKCVTGNQDVVVSGINCCNNENDINGLKVKGTMSGSTGWADVEPNTKYTIALTKTRVDGVTITNSALWGITNIMAYNGQTLISQTQGYVLNSFSSGSRNILLVYTTPDNCTKIGVDVRNNNGDENLNTEISNFRIVKGEYTSDTIPTYEPYITPTTYQLSLGDNKFYGIPNTDYRDELIYDVDEDRVYKNEKIGKYIDDGSYSETRWTNASYTDTRWANYGHIFSTPYFNSIAKSGEQLYCNYYTYEASINTLVNGSSADNIICGVNTYNANMRILNKNISTNADFKTWLTTHNLEIYYVLATPNLIEITDTNLHNQVKMLYNAQSLNGTTIITSNGNLPMIIKVRGLKGE